jgi:hypothetical protein
MGATDGDEGSKMSLQVAEPTIPSRGLDESNLYVPNRPSWDGKGLSTAVSGGEESQTPDASTTEKKAEPNAAPEKEETLPLWKLILLTVALCSAMFCVSLVSLVSYVVQGDDSTR